MFKEKNQIILIVIICFYVCVDLVVRWNINDWGRKNWNGLLVVFWLTYVLIPLFSFIMGAASGKHKISILYAIVLMTVSATLCGFVLYDLFFVNSIVRGLSTAWYVKYSFFEGVVFISSYIMTLFLSDK